VEPVREPVHEEAGPAVEVRVEELIAEQVQRVANGQAPAEIRRTRQPGDQPVQRDEFVAVQQVIIAWVSSVPIPCRR
jgi:hypothetical protein